MQSFGVNPKLPEWSLLPISDGSPPSVSDFRGKPLLVLFFSLGCPGCKGRAIPYANRLLYEKTNINIVGIHTRFEGRRFTDEELRLAKSEFFVRFPYFRDAESNKTYQRYGALGTPHWFLVDANGIVLQSIFGSDPNNALLRIDLKLKEIL